MRYAQKGHAMRILNLRNNPTLLNDPNNVYIGRAGRGQNGFFGNPFNLQKGETRAKTLERYLAYFVDRLKRDDQFRCEVLKLRGKNLVCFCAPLPCHGNIMRSFILDPEGWWLAYGQGQLPESIDASLSPPPTS